MMPVLAAMSNSGGAGKARLAMNSDIVKPIPPRTPAASSMGQVVPRGSRARPSFTAR